MLRGVTLAISGVYFYFSIKALSLLAASSASAIPGACVAPSTNKVRGATPSTRFARASSPSSCRLDIIFDLEMVYLNGGIKVR